jgi:hypothetical protein
MARGRVFHAIDCALRKYRIHIESHIAEDSTEGTIDAGLNLPAQHIPVGRKRPGEVVEGTTTLVGITFRPKNFQLLMAAFRDAVHDGLPVFHYHPLSGRNMGEQIYNNIIHADPLQISYAATKTGMPGHKELRAWGFREIKDLAPPLDDRPLLTPTVGADRRFGGRFAPPAERKIEIKALHAAITPEACNIHIDDAGFVVREPQGMVGMSPDFLQHVLNELVFKTYLRGALGEWVTDHFSVIVPNSDNGYMPTVGIGLDLPEHNLQIGVTFTFGCNCLGARQRITLDESIVPIPSGWSVGAGLTLRHDWLSGRRRRR